MKKKLTEEELYRKAFNDARKDLEETNEYNVEERAKELLNEKLLSLLSVVDMNAIVTTNKNQGLVYIGGERVEDGRLANLKAEADFLMESDIWRILQETPKHLAHEALFIKSESLDDLKKGKSMLYTLDAQQNIVNLFRGYIRK